ncbi:MAG: Maf family protein [Candidatus Syntrophosphaera sp.]|nr:Maf family protein [Candidatus Syntrophosphaera sp.]
MIHKLLHERKIVLASESPRRKALFKLLGLAPLIIPARINEPLTRETPYLQAMRHAKNKALAIAAKMDAETIVVGADTIVVLDKAILGKPETLEQAAEYLRMLSGKTHKVYTGICVCWRARCETRYERSLVEFAPLSENEIDAYIQTKEPMDKAGAYGIQGYGSQFIRRIQGCYFNVMGFPIHLFYKMINDMFSSITS